jgi:hypothetical protein
MPLRELSRSVASVIYGLAGGSVLHLGVSLGLDGLRVRRRFQPVGGLRIMSGEVWRDSEVSKEVMRRLGPDAEAEEDVTGTACMGARAGIEVVRPWRGRLKFCSTIMGTVLGPACVACGPGLDVEDAIPASPLAWLSASLSLGCPSLCLLSVKLNC